MISIKNDKNTPSSIGNRVKSARMLSRLSRKAFSDISGISVATLRTWEDPPKGRKGLTKKSADRLIDGLNKCGIICSKEWLLIGIGVGPKIINEGAEKIFFEDSDITWGEEEAIFKDIESFKENNINPLIALVSDDAMLPLFSKGDYVGGTKKSGDEIKSLVGLNCIIIAHNITIIRRIGLEANRKYTLCSLNPETAVENAIITDVEILAAAEITWHRWASRKYNI